MFYEKFYSIPDSPEVGPSGLSGISGELFGISPMAAAGLGNTLSDFIGIIFGRAIEKIIYRPL